MEDELSKQIAEVAVVVELKEEQLSSRIRQYQREKRRAEIAEELQATSEAELGQLREERESLGATLERKRAELAAEESIANGGTLSSAARPSHLDWCFNRKWERASSAGTDTKCVRQWLGTQVGAAATGARGPTPDCGGPRWTTRGNRERSAR